MMKDTFRTILVGWLVDSSQGGWLMMAQWLALPPEHPGLHVK